MKLKFLPQNISVDIKSGKSVMELARENNLPISSSCNGMCSCAECRVYIVDGEAHVLPPSAKEMELIGGGHFIDNRRLSCQLFCFGEVTVDLSEQVEREKQGGIIKKQFLKHLSKDNSEESSSVGGILVEQDQEMNTISVSEKESDAPIGDEFYRKGKRKYGKTREGKRENRQNHSSLELQSNDIKNDSRTGIRRNKRGGDRGYVAKGNKGYSSSMGKRYNRKKNKPYKKSQFQQRKPQ